MVASSGSRIKITLDNVDYPCRGDVQLKNAGGTEVTIEAHSDGSTYATVKPVVESFEMKFSHRPGLKWSDLQNAKKIDLTVFMMDTGETIFATGCRMGGKRDHNLTSGEIDGLTLGGGAVKIVKTRN